MKENLSYIIGALIVYFLMGLLLSYVTIQLIDWEYVGTWTVLMTFFDFLIIRKIRTYFTNKYNKNGS